MKKVKYVDLKPFLDFFLMLRHHEHQGMIEMKTHDHEAYVTLSLMNALTNTADGIQNPDTEDVFNAVRHIRIYAAWLAAHRHGLDLYDPEASLQPDTPTIDTRQEDRAYFAQPFILHVVKDEKPHDLLCTILVTRRRSWRTAGLWRDHFEVVGYMDEHSHDKAKNT